MTAQKHQHKPTGKAKHDPAPNINPTKKRRRFLTRAIAKATACIQSMRVFKELMRRRRLSKYWTNKGNADGVKAEQALLIAILDNLDLRTWQNTKNLEQLAEQAGLITHSHTGGQSMTRASRAAERLARLGIIQTPKAYFNPYDARCECKDIIVTPLFFELLGVSVKAAERERAKLAGEPVEEAANVTLNHPAIIAAYLANRARMNEAGLIRMKAKRDRARQLKAERYGHSPAPA